MSPWRLREISKQIDRGALIAYPTDTIWGLGCSPLCFNTVQRLQRLKRRSNNKGLILLSPQLNYLKPFIDKKIYHDYYKQLNTISEQPVTWIVKSSVDCPAWLTGNRDTIAVRLTQLNQLKYLCDFTHLPIVSTSANISGRKPIRNDLLAHKHFHQSVDYIIKGFTTRSQQSSKIINLETGKILRG